MWPNEIALQFQIVPANPGISDFGGPYNKLLYSLFLPNTPFTVIPRRRKSGSSRAPGWIVTLEVWFFGKPVLILGLRKPADLESISACQLADTHIRQRMVELRSNCPIPTLHAISAMGTALCFYSAGTRTRNARIIPPKLPHDPRAYNDTAPGERWSLDVMTEEGESKFLAVVEEIKQACEDWKTLP